MKAKAHKAMLGLLLVLSIGVGLLVGVGVKSAGKKLWPARDNVSFLGKVVQAPNGDIPLEADYTDPNNGEKRKLGPKIIKGISKTAPEADKREAVVAVLQSWVDAYNEKVASGLQMSVDTLAQPKCVDCGGGPCSWFCLPGHSSDPYGGPCSACGTPYTCNKCFYVCAPNPSPSPCP